MAKRLNDFSDQAWIWEGYPEPPQFCPCCKGKVTEKNTTIVRNIKFKLQGTRSKIKLFFDDLNKGNGKYFTWACDGCFKANRFIKGNPDLQTWCLSGPHLAYFDIVSECGSCGNDVLFTKEHQRYLYEELGLWVMTQARCKVCKSKRDLNTELSNLLKDKESLDFDKANRVADIYSQMGKEEKTKEYAAIAKRLQHITMFEPNKKMDK